MTWGPSNPLYRWKMKHGKLRVKSGRKARSRGKTMVRHKRRGGFGRSSGGKLFGLSTKGLVGLGLLGAAAGALFGDQIGSMIPINADPKLKGYAGAFALGGPAGVALKFAKDQFMPNLNIGGGSSAGIQMYGTPR